MAEPAPITQDGPSKPIFLVYPDSRPEIRLGEGVYFKPLVKVEGRLDAEEERKNFEDFQELAQSVTNCFAQSADVLDVTVRLDENFIRDVWDASAGEADPTFRVDWAVNELCDILDKTPHAGLGAGVELVDEEIWRNAKRVLVAELMESGVVKGLTFSVEPQLPEGINLAGTTGIISGHPVAACPLGAYKVICKSELGQVECSLEMEVVEAAAPQKVAYKNVERAYACGQPMVIMPKVSGLVTSWTIRPPLPKGLRQDSITGTICGIPQEAHGETTWTIIAKNDLGSTSCPIKFEVVEAAPTTLRYHADEHTDFAANRLGFCGRQAAQTFPVSRWMCLRPTVDGTAETWEVKPEFPPGVALDPETGVISGTPTVESPTTPYTITASNGGGSGKVQISFAVKNLPTIGIGYPAFDDVYCVGEALDCQPQVQGGATTWVVDPPLPDGMELDAQTGRIFGTCDCPVDEASYTITASNEVGGTSCVLTFMVIAMPPEGLSYLEMVSELFVGDEISVEPDLLCGEGNVDFFVNPALPDGLSIDKDTGAISGCPAKVMPMATYKVDAENAMGKSSCHIEFEVKERPQAKESVRHSVTGGAPQRSLSRLSGAGGEIPRADPFGQQPLATLKEEKEEDDAVTAASTNPRSPSSTPQGKSANAEEERRAAHQAQLNEFIETLQNVEDSKLLPPEPNKATASFEWMLWAAHRAMLCDPTLTTLSFKGLDIPLPDVEPRIIGKLVQAISVSRHLISLDLSMTSLRSPHTVGITQALRQNTALQILNVDGNWLDSSDVEAIVDALGENQGSKLTALLCNDQQGVDDFGKGTEQKLAKMLEKNTKITRCTIPVEDAYWKSEVEKHLKRNADQIKKAAKMKTPGSSTTKVTQKSLTAMSLGNSPGVVASEVFKGADEKLEMARLFTFEKKRLPTKEQLQVFAKNRGHPLKYSEVAPLAKNFRKMLLDTMVGAAVVATDVTHKKFEGKLNAWSEKNDKWTIDVDTEAGLFRFTSIKDPVVEVSSKVTQWLSVGLATAQASATE